jgi:hypothetical protein
MIRRYERRQIISGKQVFTKKYLNLFLFVVSIGEGSGYKYPSSVSHMSGDCLASVMRLHAFWKKKSGRFLDDLLEKEINCVVP